MDSSLHIKIISKPKDTQEYFVIYKPSGLPSAPLKNEDNNNAFSQLSAEYPQILKVVGKKEVEHGLIHRIDTVTEGLLIIAASQKAYDDLMELQNTGKIKKYYKAVCNINENYKEGFPIYKKTYNLSTNENIFISSYFRPYGKNHKEVRPVTENSGESAIKKVGKKIIYSTNVKIIEILKDQVKVECMINNGFRHQVRCHLSWIGLPIIGDKLYNLEASEDIIKFKAFKIDINGKIFQID